MSRNNMIDTPEGRVYDEMLDLQIKFQMNNDEEAEDILCDILDMWGKVVNLRALENDDIGEAMREADGD